MHKKKVATLMHLRINLTVNPSKRLKRWSEFTIQTYLNNKQMQENSLQNKYLMLKSKKIMSK